ncbi:DUF3987 domain-containing protein [Actinomadura nitritigenes]|uniref:YfjI family protein n=1 Tax=Actinomadura nitritigenes TaxID=134602 RepID=UPI003D91175E
MTDQPVDRLLDALQAQDFTVLPRGGYWSAQCPAHDDRNPSLSIRVGDRQPVVLDCKAGCDPNDVIAALGLTWPDLCSPREDDQGAGEWTPHGPATAAYDYVDEHGVLLYQVLRTAGKQFPVRVPDATAKHRWRWKLGDTRRVPYRLPELVAAVAAGNPVFIVEGEKDADSLARHGVTATCNPGGVGGGWRTEYSDFFKGADVTIVQDRDDAGRQHAAKVAAALAHVARSVRVVEAAEGKDATDHINAGHAVADLIPTETHPTNPRKASDTRQGAPAANSGISGTRSEDWDDPIPVEVTPLPAFPVERLGKLAPFVEAGAAALQTPPDLIAFACLATISMCTGGRRFVRVKPSWSESLALYMAALADSSEKKTPALNLAAETLRDVEGHLMEAARPEVEKKAQEIRITQARMAKAEQKAAGDKPDNAIADAEAARDKLLELGEAPHLPRLLIRDATLEAIAKVMYEQGGRIGLLASEGGLLKVAAGLYGSNGKANTDLLLEAFSGGPYTIDRTGRPAAHMPTTFLSMGLIVQPGVLAGIEKKNPEFRENGLLGRYLYALPAACGVDSFSAPDIPIEVCNEYDRRIRRLITSVYPDHEPHALTLTPEALHLFGQYYDDFAKRRMPGGDLYDIADWAGKFRGQLIRLAACLTLYEEPLAREIGAERIADVLAMAPYFIAHARAVFDLMGQNHAGRLKPLQDVLAWLRQRSKPGADFAAREVWQALKGRRWAEDMDAMWSVLEDLEEHGWIAMLPPPDTSGRRGRKPSPRYEVHPWVAHPPESM